MILARKSIVGPVTLCSVPPPCSHCSEKLRLEKEIWICVINTVLKYNIVGLVEILSQFNTNGGRAARYERNVGKRH